MNEIEEIVHEWGTDYRGNMAEHIAGICFEINKLKACCPNEGLNGLTFKLALLIKYCDTILMDNDEKRDKLDSSLKESAVLASKLDFEKRQREIEMNQ